MSRFRKVRYFFYIILSLLCAALFLPTRMWVLWTAPVYEITTLDSGWTVIFNETVSTDVYLNDIATHNVDRNDVLIMSNTLPDEVPTGCIEIQSVRSSIDVFLEEERIYSYGDAGVRQLIYNNTHQIRLPEGYGGRQISFLFRTNADNAFSGIAPVYVGNRIDLLHFWLNRNIRPLFYGTFLLIYGLFMLILAVFMFNALSRDIRILVSAFLVILFGLYALGYYRIFIFVFPHPGINVMVEMFSLFFIPAAVAGFLATIRGGMVQKIFFALAVFDVIFAATLMTLLGTGVYLTSEILPVFHVVLMVQGVLCLALLWVDISSGRGARPARGDVFGKRTFVRRADRVLFFGVLSIILGGMADTIRYNIRQIGDRFNVPDGGIDLTLLGVLVFAGCLLQNYFFYTVEHSNEIMMNRALANIAFTDPLTGLANRTRCEQVLQRLEKEHEDYSVLSFDIQDLKKTNDANGHGEGDRLLKGFAGILREVFRESDLIGRIGGDEFLVVMRDTPKSVCAQKELQLRQVMERYNRSERVFRYDAACGYAHKSERIGASTQDICRLADERMYSQKRRMHEQTDDVEVVHA